MNKHLSPKRIPQGSQRERLIVETDFFDDVDDLGALALANVFADEGFIDLAAVSLNTPSIWGPRAVHVVNSYYGRDMVAIGEMRPSTRDLAARDYAHYLAELFPQATATFQDSVALLRHTMAASPDHSVVLASIGFYQNLVRLLDTGPDQISPLRGKELVKRKVSRTVVMGGQYPRGREYNMALAPAMTKRFLAEWPMPTTFVGWEVGHDVITGEAFRQPQVSANPVAAAYLKYTEGQGRPSWDLIAMQIAVLGPGVDFCLSEAGRVIVSEDGTSSWESEENGLHRYVRQITDSAELACRLNRFLYSAPGCEHRQGHHASQIIIDD